MTDLAAQDIQEYLATQDNKSTLRFITCGSVDDGKSTLIGRLLYESKNIFEDQLQSLESDSQKYGTQNGQLDFALLVDGLQSEREQGITIDVAYRFFGTDKRNYIVADTPGHEQYTRNMATGASTADLAIILIDARKGVLVQTRRHTRIANMMGIKHIVLAVNKMDLVDFDEQVFNTIVSEYLDFTADMGFESIQTTPVSGLAGDNIMSKSTQTPWYQGVSLIDYLDNVDVSDKRDARAFRMPVQFINRANLDFRGFCGRVVEGELSVGDAIRVLPAGNTSTVKEIFAGFDGVEKAKLGDSVTITLNDEISISRGDVLSLADNIPEVTDQFEAKVLWMSEHEMAPGRQYLLKSACKEVTATVTEIKYREDVNTGEHLPAKKLALNEIATVNMSTSAPIVYESYQDNRILGGFILVDKLTFETVAAGMIDFALRRADNIHWQAIDINKTSRANLKHQQPKCLWLTGLSGSGKSTIANLLEKRLHAEGRHTYLLDGDNVRHGLNRDLGFTEADRVENLRRITEVAKLMTDAGLIVIVSFISPFRSERRAARESFEANEFAEIFVDTPLEICEQRDVKGLYQKARSGEIKNFTGIDSPYEAPKNSEVRLRTANYSAEQCVEIIMDKIFHN